MNFFIFGCIFHKSCSLKTKCTTCTDNENRHIHLYYTCLPFTHLPCICQMSVYFIMYHTHTHTHTHNAIILIIVISIYSAHFIVTTIVPTHLQFPFKFRECKLLSCHKRKPGSLSLSNFLIIPCTHNSMQS